MSRRGVCLGNTLLLVLPTVVVCLATLEAGLRVTGRLPSNSTEGIFVQHGISYRLRPNLEKVSRSPSFQYTIVTNAMGHRDRAPGPRRLGALPFMAWVGDSLTFANGVDYEESFVGVFDELARGRGIESANLAVGGHRFTDQENTLIEFLDATPVKPSWVIIVCTASGIATFEQPCTDRFIKGGYLLPADGWLVSYVRAAFGESSAAYAFFRDSIRTIQVQLLPATARSGLEGLEPLYRKRGPWAGTEAPARFEARLQRLDRRIRCSGATPAYVYVPTSIDLRAREFLEGEGLDPSDYDFEIYLRLVQDHANRSGLRFVSLVDTLQARHDAGEPLSFLRDPHYNVAANRIIGLALWEALLGGADEAARLDADL